MPGWQAVSFTHPDVTVEARPKSWWRKGLLQALPYIYGSKPRFLLKITVNSSIAQGMQLYWFLKFSSGDVTGHHIPLPSTQKGHSIVAEAGHRLLGFTGDTVLGVSEQPQLTSYHTVYSFRVMAVEDLIQGVAVGALLAALTLVLGLCTN